ncbi:MAG TPA: YlcI/YnfO family protein [Candidatus Limnocylindrales bacterium]
MRTTVKIDDHLLAEAKAQAARSGRTLNQVVEDALRESLARRDRAVRERGSDLPTFPGSRLAPGADLDDSSTLLDLMEGTDA